MTTGKNYTIDYKQNKPNKKTLYNKELEKGPDDTVFYGI